MKQEFFFHARISGGENVDSRVTINPEEGRRIFRQQMIAFDSSDLIRNCSKFVIGLNGSEEDREFVSRFIKDSMELVWHRDGESLLPTVALMQRRVKAGDPDTMIGFAHTKGVTQPHNQLYTNWRECMMENVVRRWRRCVTDLKSGNYDAVGVHWTHNSPQDQNAHDWGANSFFAGAFFWTTSMFLKTLPNVPDRPYNRHQWFKPELLLGCGNPRIRDYHEGAITQHV